jgi:hypothetical protein
VRHHLTKDKGEKCIGEVTPARSAKRDSYDKRRRIEQVWSDACTIVRRKIRKGQAVVERCPHQPPNLTSTTKEEKEGLSSCVRTLHNLQKKNKG